ncbi:retrovirus-related pol polyprotein from transposon TNT 1-94 [Tanacetum coccineum]
MRKGGGKRNRSEEEGKEAAGKRKRRGGGKDRRERREERRLVSVGREEEIRKMRRKKDTTYRKERNGGSGKNEKRGEIDGKSKRRRKGRIDREYVEKKSERGERVKERIEEGRMDYNSQGRKEKEGQEEEIRLERECGQGDDPIECVNKAMEFMSVVASRFPSSNNQLRTSYNLRNQATIQDGIFIVQQIQRRQTQSFAGTRNRGNAINLRGTNADGQPRVVKCYNCQGEGHMARQCTQPKRPRNTAWFKEKLMLAEA